MATVVVVVVLETEAVVLKLVVLVETDGFASRTSRPSILVERYTPTRATAPPVTSSP
jgi:hypothetical protein